MTTNKFSCKNIGRMKILCPNCGLLVQRDSLGDHEQLCKLRDLKCAAKNCDFTGPQKDLLQHALAFHKRDILGIVEGLRQTHIFQPVSIDCLTQTVPYSRDVCTQTTVLSLQPTASKPPAECSEYKPKKGAWNILYYCGRPLPSACSCAHFYGDCFGYGCQQSGRCGPDDGHSCADCQTLNLQERSLPLQGFVVEPTSWDGFTINLRASPGECVREGNIFGCSEGKCAVCRFYRSMTRNKNSFYYQFR